MDLIETIEDDEELSVVESDDSEQQDSMPTKRIKPKSRPKLKSRAKLPEFSDKFSFDIGSCADDWSNWDLGEALDSVKKPTSTTSTSLATKIARALEQKQENNNDREDDASGGSNDECRNSDADSSGDDKDNDSSEAGEEEDKEKHVVDSTSYFEAAPAIQTTDISFTNMNLSRPLLKAVNSLGFVNPTPVQARTIPIALLGKDICASAATGTGKTAAYMLPVLERLLYRPPAHNSTTRVLVLVPTRELAIQVHSVAKVLSKHTKIEICLAAGGLDLKGQEAALRKSPDVIIATPGRLLDHLHNTPSFTLNDLEILILDEADRMLDEHFMDQMNELIRLCPRGRQTMLFSATMTDEVKELVRLSLNQPVKLFVDSNTDTAYNLQQEFVRVRTKHEGDREAIVAALCTQSFHDHCLLFLSTKKDCHRMCIILGLLGLKAVELHGNLTMLQRLEALRQFKEEEVNFLVATDLAARGLDIAGVTTVINCTMPATLKQYIHRVGRTARAGKAGRSITLVGEKERKLLKEIIKQARYPVKSRIISQEIINKYRMKIAKHEEDINDILKQEKEEKELRVAEMEMNKAHNLIEHRDEILSRPARVWFTEDSKKKAQPTVAKKQKIKQKSKKLEIDPATAFAIREAKRSKKPKRLRAIVEDAPEPKRKKKAKKQQSVINTFERELTDISKKAIKTFSSKVTSKSTLKKKGKQFKSKKKFKRRK